MSSRVVAAFLAITALVVTACGTSPAAAPPGAAPVGDPPAPSASAPVRPGNSPGLAGPSPSPVESGQLIARAVQDAARRSGVPESDARVVRAEPREWPDRSLGCPRPGMGYAQAITPGLLIVVEAGGRQYEYHSDRAEVTLCEP